MSIAWAKIRGDIVHRPTRSLLIAFAVLVGAAVLSAAVISNEVLSRAIPQSYASSLPPTCILTLGDQAQKALALIEGYPGVEAVEPRRVLRGRIATNDGSFASLSFTILPDVNRQTVSRVTGASAVRGVFVERSSLNVWGFAPGDVANVRLPDGSVHALSTVGVAADAAVAPGVQDRIVYLYATPDSLASLGPIAEFDELRLRLASDADLPAHLDRLAAAGIVPERVERAFQRHPHADQMQAVLVLLAVFALAALAVATALVTNVVTVALQAEARMIGLQKALGASTRRVMVTVLGWVAAIALPAVLAGVAIGAFAARSFTGFAIHELNLVNASQNPSVVTLALITFAALGVPLLGTCIAAMRAAKVLPLDAMLPDRQLDSAKVTHSRSRSIVHAYALRNLRQKPIKVALMLFALSAGGAALVTAGTVYRSLSIAVDRIFDYRHDDLDIRLLRPVPESQLLAALDSQPGIKRAEAWGGALVSLAESDSRITSTRFGLLAPPKDTQLLTMPVAEGRWLGDESTHEIVATRSLLARSPGLGVGDKATLACGDSRVTVQIVGAIEEATEPGVFASRRVYDSLVGEPGFAGALRIKTSGNAADVARAVEEQLFKQGTVPVLLFDTGELRFATREHFAILLVLLGTIGTAALVVGGAALWSSVTVSILERRREIAVMRATGAANPVLHRMFAWQSLVLALLAVLASVLIALPASALLAAMLGQHALHIDVGLSFSWTAFMVWLMALVIVMSLATSLPLRRELRFPPARSLSYD